jgi:hypothetical protein
MISLLLRMARLLEWAQGVVRYEYAPIIGVSVRQKWLRESDDLLDEIRQRMGM